MVAMSENDEQWALVDLLKEIIEDSRDEPHFTVSEHALMGHGRIRDEWLPAHDAEVAERIAKAIEDLRGAGNAFRDTVLTRAARIAREVGKQ